MQFPTPKVHPVSMVEYANQYSELANRNQQQLLNQQKIDAAPQEQEYDNRIRAAKADDAETGAMDSKHALIQKMAAATMSRLDGMNIPEGDPRRQQALEQIVAPLRPQLAKLFNKPEMLTNPADEQALRTLAQMADGGRNKDNYVLGYDANGNMRRFNKATGLAGAVPDEQTGQPIVGSAQYSPEAIRLRERAKQEEKIMDVTDETGAVAPMRAGDAVGGGDAFNTLHGLMGVESDYNPDAVSPTGAVGATQILPSTARDPGYGVKPINLKSIRDQVRGGADYLLGLMDKYTEQGMPEKQAYKMALQAYNQGEGGANKPEAVQYADKVMARAGIKGPSLQDKADIEVKKSGEIAQEKADIETKQKAAQTRQQELQGVTKLDESLKSIMKYLYKDGEPVRNDSGRLIPPKQRMILNSDPIDRAKDTLYEYGMPNQKAQNLHGVKKEAASMVLGLMNGSLGTGVSNADRDYIAQQVGIMEKAQNINDIYQAIADVEDRIKTVKGRGEQSSRQTTSGPSGSEGGLTDAEKKELGELKARFKR